MNAYIINASVNLIDALGVNLVLYVLAHVLKLLCKLVRPVRTYMYKELTFSRLCIHVYVRVRARNIAAWNFNGPSIIMCQLR